MSSTCDAARRLEVRWSRKGYGGHIKRVHFSWGLHRRCVLCWRSEVDLIVKVVLKLLSSTKIKTDERLDATSLYQTWPPSECCAGTRTLKLISLSLQQVTQFTSNTTKATSAVSDTTRDTSRDRGNVSPVPPPEMRRTDTKYAE